MLKNEIQIVVIGREGAGKTTIATAIRKALQETGLSVTFSDTADPQATPAILEVLEQFQERRLVALVQKDTQVSIVTEQAPRPPSAFPMARRHLTLVHNADAEPQQLAA